MRRKRKIIYAFIDSQNLNLGTSKSIYRNKRLIYKGKSTIKDGYGRPKGNVDAELIVWTMKCIYEKTCDQVVIVSGDGDFAVLAEFLLEKNKLLRFIVPNYKTMSILIKKVFLKKNKIGLLSSLNNEEEKLKIKKTALS